MQKLPSCSPSLGCQVAQQCVFVADYQTFLRLNNLANDDSAKLALVGQMIMSGLEISSIQTYLGYIVHRNERNVIWRAVRLAHADFDSQHALDASTKTLKNVIDRIPNIALKGLGWMMLTTGARAMDLQRLRRKQIMFNIEKREVTVQFRITKSIRSRVQRRIVMFPWRITPVPSVCEFLVEGDENDRIFSRVTTGLMNAAMKATGSSATTYSFRRNFINHLIEKYHDERLSQKENLDKVATYTMHNDPRVIEVFYKKTKFKHERSKKEESQAPKAHKKDKQR